MDVDSNSSDYMLRNRNHDVSTTGTDKDIRKNIDGSSVVSEMIRLSKTRVSADCVLSTYHFIFIEKVSVRRVRATIYEEEQCVPSHTEDTSHEYCGSEGERNALSSRERMQKRGKLNALKLSSSSDVAPVNDLPRFRRYSRVKNAIRNLRSQVTWIDTY